VQLHLLLLLSLSLLLLLLSLPAWNDLSSPGDSGGGDPNISTDNPAEGSPLFLSMR
jgi:hypothetical protein